MNDFENLAGLIASATMATVPVMAELLIGTPVWRVGGSDNGCSTTDLENAAHYVPLAMGTEDVGFALSGGVASRPAIIAVAALALMVQDAPHDEIDAEDKRRAAATIIRVCSEIADGALGIDLRDLPEPEVTILLQAAAAAATWWCNWAGVGNPGFLPSQCDPLAEAA